MSTLYPFVSLPPEKFAVDAPAHTHSIIREWVNVFFYVNVSCTLMYDYNLCIYTYYNFQNYECEILYN